MASKIRSTQPESGFVMASKMRQAPREPDSAAKARHAPENTESGFVQASRIRQTHQAPESGFVVAARLKTHPQQDPLGRTAHSSTELRRGSDTERASGKRSANRSEVQQPERPAALQSPRPPARKQSLPGA